MNTTRTRRGNGRSAAENRDYAMAAALSVLRSAQLVKAAEMREGGLLAGCWRAAPAGLRERCAGRRG